jgi:ATP-dependent DNA helicase RecG
LIAEPLFRVKYVEKAGTGTTDMIADCLKAGLPEPDFRQCGPHFVTTLWRDWLTDTVMVNMGLNERQKEVVLYAKRNGRITNADYQKLAGITRKTAMRDLSVLVEQGAVVLVGSKRGAHYILAKKK